MLRRSLLFVACAAAPLRAQILKPVAWDTPDGAALVALLRAGGHMMYFRHADTLGEPCDRVFDPYAREGQRNLSARGRMQARTIGLRITELRIPIKRPVLAGPVFRARDTATIAFGANDVLVTESLLADDFSGPRLGWVLAEHRRLMTAPVPAGTNRVLVGHRTPAIMVLGAAVGGTALPEGAAVVLTPGADGPALRGVLMLAPIPGAGFHSC
jgi:phosphohistidine phosphatase SixA